MFKFFSIKKVDLYLIKEFVKIFSLMLCSIFILVFIVDFMEFFPKIQKFSIEPLDALKIVIFRIPNIMENFLQFIVLLSTTFTLLKMSSQNELTILYINNYSPWKLIKTYSIFIFFVGLCVIFILNFFFSNLMKESKLIENKYIIKDDKYFIESKYGIWFKQLEPNSNLEYIIRAEKVYPEKLEFKNVMIIISDNDVYKKKYNVQNMYLIKDLFVLNNIDIIEQNKTVSFKDKMLIKTNISNDFIIKQIQNKYEDVDLLPLYSLNKMIKEFNNLGFDTHKFIIKKHSIFLVPFMYVLMIHIGVLFSNNNQRNSKHFINVFKTICCGIIIYVLQNFLLELGSANKMNFILSTWGSFLFLYLFISMLLIKKIELK